MPALVLATHNIMNGERLDALVPHYRELAQRRGLALLCLQEDRPRRTGLPSDAIASALGSRYRTAVCAPACGLTLVYDQTRIELDCRAETLPALARLNWLERRYISGGVPEQRYAQLARVRADGRDFALANVHLETAGDNAHRRRQLELVRVALGGGDRVVCGDTNVFAPSRARQLRALRAVTAGLARDGVVDPEQRPTHFFARQGEPGLAHRAAALVARTGLDMPGRYDIAATNMPVTARGQLHTPGSDHDLVWVQLR